MSRRTERRLEKKIRGKAQRANAAKAAAVGPRCAVLDQCGACTEQHLPYRRQLDDKRAAVVAAFADLASADLVGPVRRLASPFDARTRLTMPAAPSSSAPGRPFSVGFYRPGTTQLVAAETCPVQHPFVLTILEQVMDALAEAPMSASAPKTKDGWFHGIGVRVDPVGERAEVTIVGRTAELPGGEPLAEKIAAIAGVVSVHLSVNPSRSSYLYGDEFVHLAGKRRTSFALGGHDFKLSPGSFFQTSAEGAEILARTVLDMLPERFETLADLYGGVGVFSRLTIGRWTRALVVESSVHAVGDLRDFLAATGLQGLEVFPAPVQDVIADVMAANPDVVILDPPRKGCDASVIDAIVARRPPVVIYVACGLAAPVRDVARLVAGGYKIDRVESVDMFPHTRHVEVIVRLS